jgi:hypothetical protein
MSLHCAQSVVLARRRVHASWHLHNQIQRLFKSQIIRKNDFLDPCVYDSLKWIAETGDLITLNRAMREAVSKLRPGIDSSILWGAIDATSFWEDTTPGRWPYMTNTRAEVLLAWVCAYRAGHPFYTDKHRAA